jgi:hypothetical protein
MLEVSWGNSTGGAASLGLLLALVVKEPTQVALSLSLDVKGSILAGFVAYRGGM